MAATTPFADDAAPSSVVRRARLARRVRVALWVLGALLFLAGACYGLRGPFVWGHYGYHAGEYSTRARHTLNHGSLLPGNVPGMSAPRSGTYYLHHPIFTPQLVSLTFTLFGDREESLRLAALLSSAATVLLLSLFIQRHYGPWWGAASLGLSALVPFNIWFAPHMDHGYPGLACVIAALITYGRWVSRRRWPSALWTCFWLFAAGNFDWTPFLFAVPLGFHILGLAIHRRGRFLAFVPLFVLAVLLPAGIHALAVQEAHQWDDFFGAYRQRTASMALTAFAEVIGNYAVDLFGKPFIYLGAAGFGLALVDLFRGKRGVRPLALVCLVVAMALHLAVFRIEVVTHAYRLIYLAPSVVLGAVETLWWLAWLAGKVVDERARLAVATVGTALLAATTAPTSWSGLFESRAHSGIPGWKTLDPNLPRPWLVRRLTAETGPDDTLYLHPSLPFRMEIGFYLKRDFTAGYLASVRELPPAAQKHAVFAFVNTALGAQDWTAVAELAAQHPFRRLGPFGVVDLRVAGPHLESYTLVPGETSQRGRWRAYWDGPYAWPVLAPDPLTAARDALAFGLPQQALTRPFPSWPKPLPSDAMALVEARNYYALVGAATSREAQEEALAGLFPAPKMALAPVLKPLPAPRPTPTAPVVAPPLPLPPPLSPSRLRLRRQGPLSVELLGVVAQEGGAFHPVMRLAGTQKSRLIGLPRSSAPGRHVGQWVIDRISLPPELAKEALVLDLYAAMPNTPPSRAPFASLVVPAL